VAKLTGSIRDVLLRHVAKQENTASQANSNPCAELLNLFEEVGSSTGNVEMFTRWLTWKIFVSAAKFASGNCEECFDLTQKHFLSCVREARAAYHSTKNFGIFETRENGMEISCESFPKTLESVEFPKCEPFNIKFWKLQEQNRMVLKFPGRNFPKFGYTSRDCPLFRKFSGKK